MKSKMPDNEMDYMDWSYKIYQDKKKKEWEAKRKAEKRERNKYWMEVITFLLMVVSVLYSCLASTIKQVWQWLLMLLKLQ